MSLGGLGIEAEGWIGSLGVCTEKEQNAFGIFFVFICKGVVGERLGTGWENAFSDLIF